MTKLCLKCKTEKDNSEFRKKSAAKDGLSPWCSNCLRQYEAEKKTAYKPTRDKYRSENKDKEYAQKKIYRDLNRDAIKAKDKEYRERTKQKSAERISAWKRANPDKRTAQFAKRRACKLQAIPGWADIKAIQSIYAKRKELEEATGITYHVHHIVPLVNDIVCGLHCEANLAIITAQENLSLGNRSWPDMP